MAERTTKTVTKRTAPVTAKKNTARPAVRRNTAELRSVHIETRKKNADDKKPFPWSVLMMSICFTLLFLFMMMNYISLEKLDKELATQEETIAELNIEKGKLEEKLEKRDTPDEVREYAENELGMVKENDTSGQYYIDIKTDDKVEMTKHEDENENGLGTLLTGAGNVLKSFFGY